MIAKFLKNNSIDQVFDLDDDLSCKFIHYEYKSGNQSTHFLEIDEKLVGDLSEEEFQREIHERGVFDLQVFRKRKHKVRYIMAEKT